MSKLGRLRIAGVTAVVALAIGFPSAVMAEGHGDTKGNSSSNPDGNGVDKPYAAAGAAAGSQGPAYHDGNNGCGQDRKFDVAPDFQGGFDDNNGHCGPKPASNSQPLQSGGSAPAEAAAANPGGVQRSAVAGQEPAAARPEAVAAAGPEKVETAGQAPTSVLGAAAAPADVAAAPAPQAAPQAGGPPADDESPPIALVVGALVTLAASSGLVLRQFAWKRIGIG